MSHEDTPPRIYQEIIGDLIHEHLTALHKAIAEKVPYYEVVLDDGILNVDGELGFSYHLYPLAADRDIDPLASGNATYKMEKL